jgi:hypothetical protein
MQIVLVRCGGFTSVKECHNVHSTDQCLLHASSSVLHALSEGDIISLKLASTESSL